MRANTEKKSPIDDRYMSREASQSFLKYLYALVVLSPVNIVLGIALFTQMQYYEDVIKKKQQKTQQRAEKAKQRMQKTNIRLQEQKRTAKENLKEAKKNIALLKKGLEKSKILYKKTKLEFVKYQSKHVVIPKNFKYTRTKMYTCGGVTNKVKEYLHIKTGIEFAFIPGGSFMMGSNFGNADERPVHKVNISPFLISKTEITQKIYRKFMNSNPSFFRGENFPVENIPWNSAKNFCDKLGFHLPAEAQWEYACRAGTKTSYYWGNKTKGIGIKNLDMGNFCWYKWNSKIKSHSVAKKLPNAFGLYDMSGNVWEWCKDNYSLYFTKGANLTKVSRGGSFDNEDFRCSDRNDNQANFGYRNVGFRVVFNLSEYPCF